MNLFNLEGQVAVITGSSRGIGKAIAERMAEHGAKVVISSRKAPACQEVADAINKRHGVNTAISVPANISSKAELENLVLLRSVSLARLISWYVTRQVTRITARKPILQTISFVKFWITTLWPTIG